MTKTQHKSHRDIELDLENYVGDLSCEAANDSTRRQSRAAFDYDRALARFDGDCQLLREIVALFIEQMPGLFARVQESLAQRDVVGVLHAAHTLRGSADAVYALDLARTALRMERIAKHDQLEAAASTLADLEYEMDRVTPLLKAVTPARDG